MSNVHWKSLPLEIEQSSQKNGSTGPVTLKIRMGPIQSSLGTLDGVVMVKNEDNANNADTGHYIAAEAIKWHC